MASAVLALALLVGMPSHAGAGPIMVVPSAPLGPNQIRATDMVRTIASEGHLNKRDITIVGDLDLSPLREVTGPIRCVSCTFTGSILAPDVVFDRLVVLSGADVRGDLALQGAVFRDGLFLRTFGRMPVIHGTTNLTLATLSLLRADQAIFQGRADLRGARFLGDASFFETDFQDLALFDQASFGGDAVFSGLPRPRTLLGVLPSGSCALTTGIFANSATFVRAVFSRTADFRQRCFGEGASFQETVFAGGADFSQARFRKTADFSSATFEGPGAFLGTSFEGPGSFRRASGAKGLDFQDAAFGSNADFVGSAVSGPLSFEGTRFGDGIDLRRLIATDVRLSLDEMSRLKGTRRDREAILTIIETSSKNRGNLATANEARYENLSLQDKDLPAWQRALDMIFYRLVAGYLVRPSHPVVALVVFLLIGMALRGSLRRREARKINRGTDGAGTSTTKDTRHLHFLRFSSDYAEGLGDTVQVAFRRKPGIAITDRNRAADYLIAALLWVEFLWFKVLIALFLLGLANSSATLRQIIDSVRT